MTAPHRAGSSACGGSNVGHRLGKKGEKIMPPLRIDDILAAWSDIDYVARDVGCAPTTPVEVGIERFVKWYREYHKL